jgi:hypothetical protein
VLNGQLIVSTGGCSDTINQTIVVMLTTGTSGYVRPLSFQVMPNPTEGELIITTRENGEKDIMIVNMLGEVMNEQMLTGNSVRIDLSDLAKGIYFVRVKDIETGKTGTKKIVLQ